MDMLSSKTLLEAMKQCDQYAGLEVCIALKSLWSSQELTDALYNEIKSNRLGEWKINRGVTRGRAAIQSVCGSHIHLLNIQSPELFRGKRFHWVLFEDGIAENALEELAYMECLSPPWEKAPDSEELDSFLCSFKIV